MSLSSRNTALKYIDPPPRPPTSDLRCFSFADKYSYTALINSKTYHNAQKSLVT